MKAFDNVQPGDIAIDYNDDQWKVIKKAPVSQWKELESWDESGWMDETSMKEYPADQGLIAVENEDWGKGVFIYAGEGAYVEEEEQQTLEDYLNHMVSMCMEQISELEEGKQNFENTEDLGWYRGKKDLAQEILSRLEQGSIDVS